MSAADFEPKVQACLDIDAGSRRLTCVPKQQLPEQLEDDNELSQLITGGHCVSCPD
jgi:hypothetical protein